MQSCKVPCVLQTAVKDENEAETVAASKTITLLLPVAFGILFGFVVAAIRPETPKIAKKSLSLLG